ncbi:MAG: hypothetical protein HZC36_04975 [Armatimonadetes bacterium]|nr:hypothetical protein [Armatimonadota bacterium]
MKRTTILVILGSIACFAMPKPMFLKTFIGAYKAPAGSALSKAMCTACHPSNKGGPVNAYGRDVDKALKASGGSELTAGILKKIEALDSDKDGVKNGDELKKGTLPGDEKSK